MIYYAFWNNVSKSIVYIFPILLYSSSLFWKMDTDFMFMTHDCFVAINSSNFFRSFNSLETAVFVVIILSKI